MDSDKLWQVRHLEDLDDISYSIAAPWPWLDPGREVVNHATTHRQSLTPTFFRDQAVPQDMVRKRAANAVP